MAIVPFLERAAPLPRTFGLTIIARDPKITDRRSKDPERTILRPTDRYRLPLHAFE